MKAEDYLDDLETVASWAAEKGKAGIDYLAQSPLPTAIGSVISNPTPQEIGAQAVNLGNTLYEGVAEEFSKSPEELALNWGPGGIGGFGAMTAYHGTPHKIVGGFKKEAIGSGEGAQAFGHGFYASDAKSIAKTYAEQVKDKARIQEINDQLSSLAKTMAKDEIPGNYGKYRTTAGQEASLKYNELINERSKIVASKGRIYTLDIPEPDVMLDWDKPVTEQIDLIKENIPDFIYEIMERRGDKISGGSFYRHLAGKLGSPEAASDYLKSIGVKGIKYPAGTISGNKTDAFNYVIFEPSDIKITAEEFLDQ